MDKVKPLDVITISEGGDDKLDFIGVVTTISVGAMSTNLKKQVTVSGKSIEFLFQYLNISLDLKASISFNNAAANTSIKVALSNGNGKTSMSIKDIAIKCYNNFKEQTGKYAGVSNTLIMKIIDNWYGSDASNFIDADEDNFLFPISSNMFEGDKVTFIDFLRKLLPQPVYEIFGYIDEFNNPKIRIRKVPFGKEFYPVKINSALITNFTLTKSCEEMYTAFMPYIEGSSMSPDFYMNVKLAQGEVLGYAKNGVNANKIKVYGFQLLSCSFVGYSNKDEKGISKKALTDLTNEMKDWYTNLDEMLSGDLTVVNYLKNRKRSSNLIESKKSEAETKITEEINFSLAGANIGNWLSFSGGSFYIQGESHNWSYGDNPTINFTLGRGGDYVNNKTFKPLEKMSAAYKELD
jgi:hypothetical protein